MAERMKDWQSSIIWVVGLIFVCGMTYNTVKSIDSRVTINTSDIKENRTTIHKNELVQTEINTKLQDIPEMKAEMKRLADYLMTFEYNKVKNGTK